MAQEKKEVPANGLSSTDKKAQKKQELTEQRVEIRKQIRALEQEKDILNDPFQKLMPPKEKDDRIDAIIRQLETLTKKEKSLTKAIESGDKPTLWQRFKNSVSEKATQFKDYAKENPVKAGLLGGLIVLGIASLIVASVFTGGGAALAVAGLFGVKAIAMSAIVAVGATAALAHDVNREKKLDSSLLTSTLEAVQGMEAKKSNTSNPESPKPKDGLEQKVKASPPVPPPEKASPPEPVKQTRNSVELADFKHAPRATIETHRSQEPGSGSVVNIKASLQEWKKSVTPSSIKPSMEKVEQEKKDADSAASLKL